MPAITKTKAPEGITPGYYLWEQGDRKFVLYYCGPSPEGTGVWHEQDGGYDVEPNWFGHICLPPRKRSSFSDIPDAAKKILDIVRETRG